MNHSYSESDILNFHNAIKNGQMFLINQILNQIPKEEWVCFVNDNSVHDTYYATALHTAVRHIHLDCNCYHSSMCNDNSIMPNRVEIVKLLLDIGVDPLITNYYGDNALDHCICFNTLFSNPAHEAFHIIVKFVCKKLLKFNNHNI